MKLTKKNYEEICDRVDSGTASDDDLRLHKMYGGRDYLKGHVPDVPEMPAEPVTPDDPRCPDDGGTDDTPPVKETEPEVQKDDDAVTSPLTLRPSLG